MLIVKRIALSSISAFGVLILFACGAGGSNDGVAQIEGRQSAETKVSQSAPTAEPKLSDEEITTKFTECLRKQGLDIPDPELNADGSVDLTALKESFALQPKSASDGPLDECLPLLEGATFSKKAESEDEIQLQDDLLALSECLRDQGIVVLAPDSSGDPREGMASLKGELKGANARTQRGIDECNELVFGAGKSAK